MKRLLQLLILLFAVLFIQACDDLDMGGEEELSEEDFVEAKGPGYSLSVPDYMKSTTALLDDASTQFQNVYKETYVIVMHETHEDFIPIWSEIGEYDSTMTPVENYQSIRLSLMEESMKIKEVRNESKKKINGLEASVVEVTGDVEDIDVPLAYFLTFIDSGDKIYMVMGWTLEERADKYRKTFATIGESFKLSE